jgi:hypothetical protein
MVAVTSNQSTASSASSAKSSDIAQGPHIVNGKQMEIVGIGNKPENGPPPGKRKKQKPRVIDKVMSKTPTTEGERRRCEPGLQRPVRYG